MKKNKILKEYEKIEEEFFDIDENQKKATIKLRFNAPSDIFDVNYLSKKPVLSDDFLDWIKSAFDIIPAKYKINLDVSFTDMQGYSAEELNDIFKKNMMLEYKTSRSKRKSRNNIAFTLMGIGALFFIVMLFIEHLWVSDSILQKIFVYVSDICTTVTFWEALTILVVENHESRVYSLNLLERFSSIKFHAKYS